MIIPGFYPGFTTGYYFQGPARPKRLLPYNSLPFLISFNTVALQFANWPSNKCCGGFRYPRPAFSLNSITLQFVNQFSLGAALQFAGRFSLGAALQFASRFSLGATLQFANRFSLGTALQFAGQLPPGNKKGNKELKESKE